MIHSIDNSELSAMDEKELISPDEQNMRTFVTQMLRSRLFLGQFQERRYVDSLKSYRDVIVVNDSESNLKYDLDVVRKRLRSFYGGGDHWIGLTGPEFIGAPTGHCIWIDSTSTTFGCYWYKIKNVRFRDNETLLKLKIVRAMSDTDTMENTRRSIHRNNLSEMIENFSFDATVENIRNTAIMYVNVFFRDVLTANNIKETLKFLSVLLVTSATFSVKGITFFMEFLLRFMHEVSGLIHASTPMMIAVVNLFGKIIAGFYFLIAMIWRDSTQPKQPYITYQRAQAPRRAIEMPRYRRMPSSLSITEIE